MDGLREASFAKLIPNLYVLRELKGYTFKDITKLVNLCGCRLKQSTIRDYYSEMQPQLMAACLQAVEREKNRVLVTPELSNDLQQLSIEQVYQNLLAKFQAAEGD